jgi:peptidoglycan hydrolase-like protein with peptidoglycan-binding domain
VLIALLVTACGSGDAADVAVVADEVVDEAVDQADADDVDDLAVAGEQVRSGAAAASDGTEPAVVTPAAPETEVVEAMDPPLEPVGTSSGPATQRAQERLLELGFWVQATTGEYGATTRQAVMAFQKYYGLATDAVLGPITAAALSEAIERPTGRSTAGDLVEVDKSKQLVYIVRDGVTEWVLNASTGSEVPYEKNDQNTPGEIQTGDSVTRTGLFEVYREREEGWWEGDLGEIYRPKYFDYGIALHGANKVPDYPASHGCVRLSIPAMDWIWDNDIVPKGTPVWVHGEIPVDESDDA